MSKGGSSTETSLPRSRTASDYDQLPYPSLPVAYCQPSALAAMASIFGVRSLPVENARVLELGCASGGNIIPLAIQYPSASFVGIDISQAHVADANRKISALGLRNIKIEQCDLTKAEFEPRAFDYVLCHGVFSWVNQQAQDAIFRVCSISLADQGLAAISFNVLPGWHLRRVVRDICIFHAGTEGSPIERAGRARSALVEIAKGLKGNDLYSNLLRNEAQRIQKMPSAYVVGEFLAESNLPCHFTEFYARARQVGLAYLCDAEVATSLPEYIAPNSAENIRALSQGSSGAAQQYIDFFTGRPFRRALLVRDGRVEANAETINVANLRNLNFAAELVPEHKSTSGEGETYLDTKGRKLTPKDPQANALLARLASAFPSTLSLKDLMDSHSGQAKLEADILKTMLGMMGRGQASAFAVPLHVAKGNGEKPIAWAMARLDAQTKQPWVTSQHHRAVRLFPSLALLLPLMDGTRDRAQLQAILADTNHDHGGPSAPRQSNGSASHKRSAEAELNAAIGYAARNGLLVA